MKAPLNNTLTNALAPFKLQNERRGRGFNLSDAIVRGELHLDIDGDTSKSIPPYQNGIAPHD